MAAKCGFTRPPPPKRAQNRHFFRGGETQVYGQNDFMDIWAFLKCAGLYMVGTKRSLESSQTTYRELCGSGQNKLAVDPNPPPPPQRVSVGSFFLSQEMRAHKLFSGGLKWCFLGLGGRQFMLKKFKCFFMSPRNN